MSIADWGIVGSGAVAHVPGAQGVRALHRLAVVRRQQGVSIRNVARHLRVDAETVKRQEQESTDIPLSVLYQWQRVLDVPVAELLVDLDGPLSPPVLARARMIKLMKTAAAIHEKSDNTATRRLVQMLVDQLLEIMPELKDISPWHAAGQRRTLDDLGQCAQRHVPDDLVGG